MCFFVFELLIEGFKVLFDSSGHEFRFFRDDGDWKWWWLRGSLLWWCCFFILGWFEKGSRRFWPLRRPWVVFSGSWRWDHAWVRWAIGVFGWFGVIIGLWAWYWFWCTVEMMVIGVDLDHFCLSQLLQMKEFIMCGVFQFQYFHIDGPIDLWHLGSNVINIDPCQSE